MCSPDIHWAPEISTGLWRVLEVWPLKTTENLQTTVKSVFFFFFVVRAMIWYVLVSSICLTPSAETYTTYTLLPVLPMALVGAADHAKLSCIKNGENVIAGAVVSIKNLQILRILENLKQ